MVTNSKAADAYPISCFTWLILYKEQAYGERTAKQAEATIQLLDWMINPQAQELTTHVHYSPLPASAVASAKNLLRSITYKGEPILK